MAFSIERALALSSACTTVSILSSCSYSLGSTPTVKEGQSVALSQKNRKFISEFFSTLSFIIAVDQLAALSKSSLKQRYSIAALSLSSFILCQACSAKKAESLQDTQLVALFASAFAFVVLGMPPFSSAALLLLCSAFQLSSKNIDREADSQNLLERLVSQSYEVEKLCDLTQKNSITTSLSLDAIFFNLNQLFQSSYTAAYMGLEVETYQLQEGDDEDPKVPGISVTAVSDHSLAKFLGFEVGDRIVSVMIESLQNGNSLGIQSRRHFDCMLRHSATNSDVEFCVEREWGERFAISMKVPPFRQVLVNEIISSLAVSQQTVSADLAQNQDLFKQMQSLTDSFERTSRAVGQSLDNINDKYRNVEAKILTHGRQIENLKTGVGAN